MEKPYGHWQNPISPAHQLLNKGGKEGKLVFVGENDRVSPKHHLHHTETTPAASEVGLAETPGLSPVHAWGPVGVTMLQKETGF